MIILSALIIIWLEYKFEFINKHTRNNYIFLWFMLSVSLVVFRYVSTYTTKGLSVMQIVCPGHLLNQVHNIVDVYLCMRLLLLIRLIVVLQLSLSNYDCLSSFLQWFIVSFIWLSTIIIAIHSFILIKLYFWLYLQNRWIIELTFGCSFLGLLEINISVFYKIDRDYCIIIIMYQEA